MASYLEAMAIAMASNLPSDGLQPRSDGLQPSSDGLQPSSDGLQPKSDGLQPKSDAGPNPTPSTSEDMQRWLD